MKRTLWLFALVGAIAIAMAALAQARPHVARTRTAAGVTCPVSDPSRCPAGCRQSGPVRGAAAIAGRASSAAGTAMMNRASCPGVDPANCPAGCPRSSARGTATTIASR
jgi:hypothetical protein